MKKRDEDRDMKGLVPESWHCVDCGFNTAPGFLNRVEFEKAIDALADKWDTGVDDVLQTIGRNAEVYIVRSAVWKKSGMPKMGGCLCIGCLEKRLKRVLPPERFSARASAQHNARHSASPTATGRPMRRRNKKVGLRASRRRAIAYQCRRAERKHKPDWALDKLTAAHKKPPPKAGDLGSGLEITCFNSPTKRN